MQRWLGSASLPAVTVLPEEWAATATVDSIETFLENPSDETAKAIPADILQELLLLWEAASITDPKTPLRNAIDRVNSMRVASLERYRASHVLVDLITARMLADKGVEGLVKGMSLAQGSVPRPDKLIRKLDRANQAALIDAAEASARDTKRREELEKAAKAAADAAANAAAMEKERLAAAQAEAKRLEAERQKTLRDLANVEASVKAMASQIQSIKSESSERVWAAMSGVVEAAGSTAKFSGTEITKDAAQYLKTLALSIVAALGGITKELDQKGKDEVAEFGARVTAQVNSWAGDDVSAISDLTASIVSEGAQLFAGHYVARLSLWTAIKRTNAALNKVKAFGPAAPAVAAFRAKLFPATQQGAGRLGEPSTKLAAGSGALSSRKKEDLEELSTLATTALQETSNFETGVARREHIRACMQYLAFAATGMGVLDDVKREAERIKQPDFDIDEMQKIIDELSGRISREFATQTVVLSPAALELARSAINTAIATLKQERKNIAEKVDQITKSFMSTDFISGDDEGQEYNLTDLLASCVGIRAWSQQEEAKISELNAPAIATVGDARGAFLRLTALRREFMDEQWAVINAATRLAHLSADEVKYTELCEYIQLENANWAGIIAQLDAVTDEALREAAVQAAPPEKKAAVQAKVSKDEEIYPRELMKKCRSLVKLWDKYHASGGELAKTYQRAMHKGLNVELAPAPHASEKLRDVMERGCKRAQSIIAWKAEEKSVGPKRRNEFIESVRAAHPIRKHFEERIGHFAGLTGVSKPKAKAKEPAPAPVTDQALAEFLTQHASQLENDSALKAIEAVKKPAVAATIPNDPGAKLSEAEVVFLIKTSKELFPARAPLRIKSAIHSESSVWEGTHGTYFGGITDEKNVTRAVADIKALLKDYKDDICRNHDATAYIAAQCKKIAAKTKRVREYIQDNNSSANNSMRKMVQSMVAVYNELADFIVGLMVMRFTELVADHSEAVKSADPSDSTTAHWAQEIWSVGDLALFFDNPSVGGAFIADVVDATDTVTGEGLIKLMDEMDTKLQLAVDRPPAQICAALRRVAERIGRFKPAPPSVDLNDNPIPAAAAPVQPLPIHANTGFMGILADIHAKLGISMEAPPASEGMELPTELAMEHDLDATETQETDKFTDLPGANLIIASSFTADDISAEMAPLPDDEVPEDLCAQAIATYAARAFGTRHVGSIAGDYSLVPYERLYLRPRVFSVEYGDIVEYARTIHMASNYHRANARAADVMLQAALRMSPGSPERRSLIKRAQKRATDGSDDLTAHAKTSREFVEGIKADHISKADPNLKVPGAAISATARLRNLPAFKPLSKDPSYVDAIAKFSATIPFFAISEMRKAIVRLNAMARYTHVGDIRALDAAMRHVGDYGYYCVVTWNGAAAARGGEAFLDAARRISESMTEILIEEALNKNVPSANLKTDPTTATLWLRRHKLVRHIKEAHVSRNFISLNKFLADITWVKEQKKRGRFMGALAYVGAFRVPLLSRPAVDTQEIRDDLRQDDDLIDISAPSPTPSPGPSPTASPTASPRTSPAPRRPGQSPAPQRPAPAPAPQDQPAPPQRTTPARQRQEPPLFPAATPSTEIPLVPTQKPSAAPPTTRGASAKPAAAAAPAPAPTTPATSATPAATPASTGAATAGTTPAATGKFVLSPADRKELEELLAQATKGFEAVEASREALLGVDPKENPGAYGYNESLVLARAQGGFIDNISSQAAAQNAKSTLRSNLALYQDVDRRLQTRLNFAEAKRDGLLSVNDGLARLTELAVFANSYAKGVETAYPGDSQTSSGVTRVKAELAAALDAFRTAAFKADKQIKANNGPDSDQITKIVTDFSALVTKAERDIEAKRVEVEDIEKRSLGRARAAQAPAPAPTPTEPSSRPTARSASRGRRGKKEEDEIVLTPGATPVRQGGSADDEIVLTPGATPVRQGGSAEEEEIVLTPGATPAPAAAGRQSRSVSRSRSGSRPRSTTSMVREIPGLSMDDDTGPKVREFLEKIFEKHPDRVFIASAMATKPTGGKIMNVMVMVPGEATFPSNREAERRAATGAAKGTVLRFLPSDGGETKLREKTFIIPVVYDSLDTEDWPIKRAVLQRMAGALARAVAGNLATSNAAVNAELRSSDEPFGPQTKLNLDGTEGEKDKYPTVVFGLVDSLANLRKADYNAQSVTKEPARNLFGTRKFEINTDGLMQGFVSGVTSAQARSRAIAGDTHTGKAFESRSEVTAIGDEQAAYGSGTDTDFSDLETARAEVGAEQRGAPLPAAPTTPTGRNDAPSAGLSEEWDNWV